MVVVYVPTTSTWELFPPGYCELPTLYFNMYTRTRTRTLKQVELYPQLIDVARTKHVTLKFSSSVVPSHRSSYTQVDQACSARLAQLLASLTPLPPWVQRSPLRCLYPASTRGQLVKLDTGSQVASNTEYPFHLTRYNSPRPQVLWSRMSSTSNSPLSSAGGLKHSTVL